MAYTRSDIRTELRSNLHEATADLWTDSDLNLFINAEIRSLPRRDIYAHDVYTFTPSQNITDYAMSSNIYEIDQVDLNIGSSSVPFYDPLEGWEYRGGVLYLGFLPSGNETIRVHTRYKYTTLTDDVTASDIPDDIMDVVIWGSVVRALKAIMGYFVNAKNWDAVAKPDGISMAQVQGWLRDARSEYNTLVKAYKRTPPARDIDMVN